MHVSLLGFFEEAYRQHAYLVISLPYFSNILAAAGTDTLGGA